MRLPREPHIRIASTADARALAELLNLAMERGKGGALKRALTTRDLAQLIGSNPGQSVSFLAETHAGEIIGFQTIAPIDDGPGRICDIATFLRGGQDRLKAGSALFAALQPEARSLGYHWINASVAAQNEFALGYYQSRGFEPVEKRGKVIMLRYNLR